MHPSLTLLIHHDNDDEFYDGFDDDCEDYCEGGFGD